MNGKVVTICFPVENIDIERLNEDRYNILESQYVLIKSGHRGLAKSLDLAVATIEKLIEHYSISVYENHAFDTPLNNEEI